MHPWGWGCTRQCFQELQFAAVTPSLSANTGGLALNTDGLGGFVGRLRKNSPTFTCKSHLSPQQAPRALVVTSS